MKISNQLIEHSGATSGLGLAALVLPPKSFVRMFKPRFAALVESGEKCQTVRPTPKRIPEVGDKISLRCWTGAPCRSKQRVLREATISNVEGITITDSGMIRVEPLDAALNYFPDRGAFAVAEGFSCWEEMRQWLAEEHGLPFSGVLISWRNVELSDSRREKP